MKKEIFWGLIVIMSSLIILLFRFYRFPKIVDTSKKEEILSPAHGIIKKIEKTKIKDKEFTLISFFLNVHDVHFQFLPLEAVKIGEEYHKGTFHPAGMFEKSKFNERMEHYFQTDYGNMIIVQIAGLLARRIHSFMNVDDHFDKAQPFGFIEFGSRVDLYLEGEPTLHVKEGDKMYVGDIIGNF